MLPDILTAQLDLVVCGTAAGNKSAALKQYYAKRGNKFWQTLYLVGLTPRILAPAEYQDLLTYKIGLTDLVKTKSGIDSGLAKGDFGNAALAQKIRDYQPNYLCFNGKRAAQEFLGRKVTYGLQPEQISQTNLFVAPSTSGAANRWWDIAIWADLKERCRAFVIN